MPPKNKLLLVEDDELLRELLHELLSDDGFEVIDAQDGVEAQGLIQSDCYSVIICDLLMPNMDGIAFLRWLRERDATTPVFVLSGAESSKAIEELSTLGIRERFRKPLIGDELNALSERLKQFVDG